MSTFTERWFAGPKQRRLAEAMGAVTAPIGAVMEVGCWEGRSTTLIAQHFFPAAALDQLPCAPQAGVRQPRHSPCFISP